MSNDNNTNARAASPTLGSNEENEGRRIYVIIMIINVIMVVVHNSFCYWLILSKYLFLFFHVKKYYY